MEKAPTQAPSSYDQIAPVLIGQGTFEEVMAKDKADKPEVMARQNKLLADRYDTTSNPDPKVKMTTWWRSCGNCEVNGAAAR